MLHKGPTVYRRIVFPTAALEARARWRAVNGKAGKTMLRVRVYYLDDQRVREYPPALFRYSSDPLNALLFSRQAAIEEAMREAAEATDAYFVWLGLALQDENTLLFDGLLQVRSVPSICAEHALRRRTIGRMGVIATGRMHHH